jgi:hypothetical protein
LLLSSTLNRKIDTTGIEKVYDANTNPPYTYLIIVFSDPGSGEPFIIYVPAEEKA